MQHELKETQQQLKQKDNEIQQLNITVHELDQQLTKCFARNTILNEKLDILEKESEHNFIWCFNSITKSVNTLAQSVTLSVVDEKSKMVPGNKILQFLLYEQNYDEYVEDKIPPSVNVLKAIEYKNEKYGFDEFKKCFIEHYKYSYEERVKHLLKYIDTGKIYRNGNKLYFKLHLKNAEMIKVNLRGNVESLFINQVRHFSNMKVLFSYNDFCLFEHALNGYQVLWIQKRGFDNTNTSIFLLPVKNNCEKLRLKIDDANTVKWQDYKNQNNEVLFQIQIPNYRHVLEESFETMNL